MTETRKRPPAKTPRHRNGDSSDGNGRSSDRARKARPKRKRASWRVWFRRLTFAVILLGVGCVGVGFVVLNSVKIPDPKRTVKTTSFVCLSDVADGKCAPSSSVAQFSAGGSNRIDVDLADVSGNLINAVVAAEDRSFFNHGGIDPWGIARALYRDFAGSASRQGGSTITQQYVKQVYLNADRTPQRKLKEAAIAIKLERKLSKRQILERYLNEVPLGRGAIGVEAASRAYFDKDATDLDIAESAFLAGLIRAPRYADDPSDPAKPAEAKEAKRRRKTVLNAMVEEGFITPKEAKTADETPFEGHVLQSPPASNGAVVRKSFADVGGKYIAEWVRRQLVANPEIGQTKLYEQGLRVYLTVDPHLQATAQLSVASVLNQPTDPSAAMVSVDENGGIKALIGGQNFDASEVNYALGSAGGGSGRAPGSTFKPIALAEWINENNSVKAQKWGPKEHSFPELNDGEPWVVKNYEDKDFPELTIEQATWQSVNTVYAQMMLEITPKKFVDMARTLGVTGNIAPVPAAVLGGGAEVSPLDLATMYSTFANSGVRKAPYIIRRVEAGDGTVLYDVATDESKKPVPAIPQPVADTVNSVLTGVVNQPVGTAYKARLKTKAAGKTGTTDDYRDAWFAGYTCHVTTVVWMGYDNKPGEETKYMDNVHTKKVTGGSFPADIWRGYMNEATKGQRGCAFKATDSGTNMPPPDPAFAPAPPPAAGTPAAPDPNAPTTTAPAAGAATTTAPPAG